MRPSEPPPELSSRDIAAGGDARRAPLRHGMKPRQLIMMGLGSAIGAGLFLGSGIGVQTAGPAVLVSYLIAGALVIIVMPCGKNREKLVTLLDELKRLKIQDHPHAFCFLLRSMFEISAKAYCKDHQAAGGPSATKADATERSLVEILRDVVGYLTKNKTDKVKLKELQGAMTQLAKSDSILSVTSMNQLVHNPKFLVSAHDICILFANVFPLLEEMNK